MRILFLVHRVPYPPDKGDRIRSYNVLLQLARLGTVDVAFIADEAVPVETMRALSDIGEQVFLYDVGRWRRWIRASGEFARGKSATEGLFWSAQLYRDMQGWQADERYDAIVLFSSSMVPYVATPALSKITVADLVDVDSQKFAGYARRSSIFFSWLFRAEQRRVERLEQTAAGMSAVVLATEAEAELYRRIIGEGDPKAIANGVDLAFFQPDPDARSVPRSCVFTGTLDYFANADGLEWFCHEVWPFVRNKFPDALFQVVGRRPVARVRQLGRIAGVTVVGEVPDVRPYLTSAAVAVAPLLVARGVQNKVLEAMASGVPVIGSTAALEGLAIEPEGDALRADDPDEWLKSLTALWTNDGLRSSLGASGRRYVERAHSWATCLSPFDALLKNAAKASTRHVSVPG